MKNLEEEKRLVLADIKTDPAVAFNKLKGEFADSPIYAELAVKVMEAALSQGKSNQLAEWFGLANDHVNQRNKLVPLAIPEEFDKMETEEQLRTSGTPKYLLKPLSFKGFARKVLKRAFG